jgi:hypothetical protein
VNEANKTKQMMAFCEGKQERTGKLILRRQFACGGFEMVCSEPPKLPPETQSA